MGVYNLVVPVQFSYNYLYQGGGGGGGGYFR